MKPEQIIKEGIKYNISRHPASCSMRRSFNPLNHGYLGCDCGLVPYWIDIVEPDSNKLLIEPRGI